MNVKPQNMAKNGVADSVCIVTDRKHAVTGSKRGVPCPVCTVTIAKRAVTNAICDANEPGNVANRHGNGANEVGNGANRPGNGANEHGNERNTCHFEESFARLDRIDRLLTVKGGLKCHL